LTDKIKQRNHSPTFFPNIGLILSEPTEFNAVESIFVKNGSIWGLSLPSCVPTGRLSQGSTHRLLRGPLGASWCEIPGLSLIQVPSFIRPQDQMATRNFRPQASVWSAQKIDISYETLKLKLNHQGLILDLVSSDQWSWVIQDYKDFGT